MLQSGFFDLQNRFDKLDRLGDLLKALNEVVDWSVFEPILAKGLKKEKKTNAGRRGAMMPRDMTPNAQHQRRRAAPSAVCCC